MKSRKIKFLIAFINLLFICLFCGSGFNSLFAQDRVVAIVNKEVITQRDLDDFINFMRMQMSAQYSEKEIEDKIKQALPDLISRLIEDRLILQAARKENIKISSAQIKARLEEMKRQYSTEDAFNQALIAQGLTLSDIEAKIREQLLTWEIIDQKIKSKIIVTPQEITDYYQKHKSDYYKTEQRLTRFILVQDPEMISKIKSRGNVYVYKDLDSLAKLYSLDITDLGWVTKEQLRDEIAKVVFNLEVGKLSAFSDSEKNFYIFEVMAIKPPALKTLFEAQEEISNLLFRNKMQQALLDWLAELKSSAYIEIKAGYESD